MNTNERTKAVEKIRKLLALGSSPNEEEAKAAMAKAHELLVRYNMTECEVDAEAGITEEIVREQTPLGGQGRFDRVKWKMYLLHILQNHFLVVVVYMLDGTKKTPVVMGRKVNVELFNHAFVYVSRVVESMSLEYVKASKEGKRLKTAWEVSKARDSYAQGIVHRFSLSLDEQEKKEKEMGLVATSGVDVSEFENMQSKLSAQRDEFSDGFHDGKDVRLRGAIKGKKNNARVLAIK